MENASEMRIVNERASYSFEFALKEFQVDLTNPDNFCKAISTWQTLSVQQGQDGQQLEKCRVKDLIEKDQKNKINFSHLSPP